MTITSPPAGSRGRIDRIIWRLRQAQAKSSFKRYVGRYVAITGSCGKTTTTALAGELLGAFGSTTAGSIENANLWLFRHIRRLRRRVDFLVQEVSGFPIGTIETAVQTYRVDVAVQ